MQAVAKVVIEKARQTNTKLVIWGDGKVVEINPDELMDTTEPKT